MKVLVIASAGVEIVRRIAADSGSSTFNNAFCFDKHAFT